MRDTLNHDAKDEERIEMKNSKVSAPEPEWEGSIWKHPYMAYIVLTLVLFAFIMGMGWLAWTQGWTPERSVK